MSIYNQMFYLYLLSLNSIIVIVFIQCHSDICSHLHLDNVIIYVSMSLARFKARLREFPQVCFSSAYPRTSVNQLTSVKRVYFVNQWFTLALHVISKSVHRGMIILCFYIKRLNIGSVRYQVMEYVKAIDTFLYHARISKMAGQSTCNVSCIYVSKPSLVMLG